VGLAERRAQQSLVSVILHYRRNMDKFYTSLFKVS
jgi:hypothetical protein